MSAGKRKYIVILGSLMSGLGKGILSSSIAKILQSKGLSVVPIKFDGYLNVDCGTMNPFRHGEVFVLDDGTECDMDFGTYERFLNIDLTGMCSITGGKLFKRIIEKERAGGYLGRDVQIVPHLTDEIKSWVKSTGEQATADVVLIEVGGTVGDLENGYFIEAMRQLSFEESTLFIQLTYVHSLSQGELKTKPTQHANRLIASMGIRPSIIVCREDEPLTKEAREKIALYCNIEPECVFDDPKVDTIYELPQILEKQKFGEVLMKELNISNGEDGLRKWRSLVEKIKNPKNTVRIAIAGKYTAVKDAYVSVTEALVHAGAHNDSRIEVRWIETSEIEDGKPVEDLLKSCDGLIVPGGFGKRGVEGKIKCIEYARKNGMPYLGLCLGLQMMTIEWARNVAGLKDANSTEFDESTKHPVIDFLPEQRKIKEKGATMRLGAWECDVAKGTHAHKLYGCDKAGSRISERHRHRWEVNNDYLETLMKSGFVIAGKSPDGTIIEMVEWPQNGTGGTTSGFGAATQAHPELKSRLEKPAPLFVGLVEACLKRQQEKK
ncbi:CTP synthase [Candidatus Parvarchaeota archaeon]|nr:CTP synthase [Candidatus Parvarchaeota archaeon]